MCSEKSTYPNSLVILFVILLFSIPSTFLLAQESQQLLEKATLYHFNKPDSALLLNIQLEKLAKKNSSIDTLAIARNRQAAIHYLKSDYVQSMKDFLQAYQWALSVNNKKEIAYAENGRGLVYLGQLRYLKAIEAFQKSLQINESNADTSAMGRNLFNIGICKRELDENEASLAFFDHAIQIIKAKPLNYLYVMVTNQKAKSLFKLQRFDEALALYQEVIALDSISNNWERAFAYTGLAEIDLAQNKYEEALVNSQKGLDYAENLGALWDKARALNVLWQAEEAIGRLPNALTHAKTYLTLKDSLYNQEKDAQISSLELELATLKNQNLENNLALAQQKQSYTLAVIIGSTFTIVLLIVLVLHYKRTIQTIHQLNGELQKKNDDINKQRNTLEEMNKAKNQIFSIVSHDMRGPIRSVIQILEMEKAGELSPEEKNDLDEIILVQLDRTRKMMDEMLDWANNQMEGLKKEPKLVNLAELINEEEYQMEISLKAKKISYTFEDYTKDPTVTTDPNQLKVILQNIIGNAIKFTNIHGQLTISLKEKDGFKLIEITDDGIGMDEETLNLVRKRDLKIPSKVGTFNEQGTGIGLLLTHQLLKANQMDLTVDSELGKGSTFTIAIPVDKK